MLARSRRLALSLLCAAAALSLAGTAAPASSGLFRPQAAAAGERDVPRPELSRDKIAFGAERKRQTAGYSKRHYGQRTWKLRNPHAVVLHWTAGPSWQSARDTFASNEPSLGESPGVCSHYIVEKSGEIHLIVSERIRCRHTIGLNWTAVGIEFVQESKGSARATDRAILRRGAQMRAGLRLVAYLRDRYEIEPRDIVGHAGANESRWFKERRGWRNDHSDWQPSSVREFRQRLRAKFG